MSLFGHDNVIDYCNLEQTTLNLNVFPIGNEMIDIIQDYTYLEIRISSSGNFTFHLNIFHKKAFHRLFSLRRHIDFSKLKPSLASQIFDTMGMISPILPYNSEIRF